MDNNFSIYVHIPFCDSKCYYCDFNSGIYAEEIKKKYFKFLKKEICQKKLKGQVSSIYFGGGTPSSVDAKYVCEILTTIKKNFNVSKDAEITIEGNPNSLTLEKLKAYFNAGFNRLSIGVQTLNKKSLEFIGRIQNKENLKKYKKSVKNAIKNAKKAGFENISGDLMLGLPENNIANLKKDVKFLAKNCNHISSYMLILEEGTPLFERIKNSDDREEKSIKEYEVANNILKKYGFKRYEISNFKKGKFASKHNLNYWACGEYLGFGLSAHSFVDNYRFYNPSSFEKYFAMKEFSKKKKDKEELMLEIRNDKTITAEKLTKKQSVEEMIMLALRTSDGLNLLEFKNKFYDLTKRKGKEIAELLSSGYIEGLPDKMVLTEKGIFVANQIILKLI